MTATLTNLLLNDRGVAFDPAAGETYQLSATALNLIRLLQHGENEASLLQHLIEKYDVEESTACRDLASFLGQLEEIKWI